MIKRYRWTLVIGTLFVLWLAFGSQLIDGVFHNTPRTPPLTGTITPELGLSGTLFYTQGDDGITRIDLASGEIRQWWRGSEAGESAHGIAVTESGDLVVAIDGGLYQTGRETLDLNPLLVLESAYFDSPFVAGEWLYFTRYDHPRTRDPLEPGRMMSVERLRLDSPDVREIVVENAEQPAVKDHQLVYIAYNPDTAAQSLWIADVDGMNPRQLVPATAFDALIAPRFYGDSVIFGASGDLRASNSRVNVAQAHGPPWSIWQVSLDDDRLDQVLLLSFDGPWVAPTAENDFFVLDAENVYWIGAIRIERLAASTAEGALIYLPAEN